MAPGYRNQNRRQTRTGYVDHDVFEGLPVRHWRRDYITVAPPQSQDTTASQNDTWAIELPHLMPKDYHLLPQHSQDLLRGARSGRIYKRPAPPEEDEVEVEGVAGDKPDKKEDDTKGKGFSVKSWKQIPRHLEGPDIEYLAKRRKGLITVGSKAPKPIPTVTKTKLKRIDAAGNEYVQDVIVPHGQKVDGEVISQVEIPDPNAVAAAGLAVQPTPTRRKTASRKKAKGPARGRKKKAAAPTSAPISQLDGITEPKPAPAFGQDGVKIETEGSVPPQNEDTEMHDGSAAVTEDESSDEGEEGDDDEGSVDHTSPSKPRWGSGSLPHLPIIPQIPDLTPEDTPMTRSEAHPHSHPILRLEKEAKSGSPLKNVVMTTSAVTSPLEAPRDGSANPFAAPIPSEHASEQASKIHEIEEEMQQEVPETAPTLLPEVPPHPTEDLIPVSIQVVKEELEEENMLLNIDAGTGNVTSDKEDQNTSIPAEQEPPVPEVEVVEAEAEVLDATALEAPQVEQSKTETDEASDLDDDFPDLLGDLEKSLQRTAPVPAVPEASNEATAVEVPGEESKSPEKEAEAVELLAKESEPLKEEEA